MEAASVIRLGLDRLKQSSGTAQVLTWICDAANFIGKHGLWDEAIELRTRVVEVHQRAYGWLTELTLQAVSISASLLEDGARYIEAEAEYHKVFRGQQQLLAADHPQTVAYEVFEARRLSLGLDHKDTESSVALLLTILYKQEKSREAETLLRDLRAYRAATLGSMHPATLKAGARVVDALARQKRLDEAIKTCVALVQDHEKTLESDHLSTMAMTRKLAQLQYTHSNIPVAESLHRKILSRLGKN